MKFDLVPGTALSTPSIPTSPLSPSAWHTATAASSLCCTVSCGGGGGGGSRQAWQAPSGISEHGCGPRTGVKQVAVKEVGRRCVESTPRRVALLPSSPTWTKEHLGEGTNFAPSFWALPGAGSVHPREGWPVCQAETPSGKVLPSVHSGCGGVQEAQAQARAGMTKLMSPLGGGEEKDLKRNSGSSRNDL